MIEFRFAHPLALLLLPLACLGLIYWLRGQWRLTPPLLRYSDTRLLEGLPSGCRVRLRHIPNVLRLAAWVLLVTILARPQFGQAQEIIRGEGIDIALALDISSSMSSPDFAPENRLEAAKKVITEFIDAREFDRIGLVVFANDAYHQSPSTLDYGILKQLLDNVQLASTLGIQDGSAIGRGVASAANMLRPSTAINKVIILLTDGDNNIGSIDPITAGEAARAFGIRIYAIGMGQSGVITFTNHAGEVETLESDLNEDILQRLAAVGGGQYFNATDLTSLEAVYNQINLLEQSPFERRVLVRWQDQADGFMIFALILLLLERFFTTHNIPDNTLNDLFKREPSTPSFHIAHCSAIYLLAKSSKGHCTKQIGE